MRVNYKNAKQLKHAIADSLALRSQSSAKSLVGAKEAQGATCQTLQLFWGLVDLLSGRIRNKMSVSIMDSSLEKSFLEVSFEISEFGTVSSVFVARRILIHLTKRHGYTRFNFKNKKEHNIVEQRIQSVLFTLKRCVR